MIGVVHDTVSSSQVHFLKRVFFNTGNSTYMSPNKGVNSSKKS